MGKKLLLAAVVLGVGGWFAYAKVVRPPAKRACARLADLCGDPKRDDHECTDFFDSLQRNDAASVDKVTACVADARTCAEAVGCTAGGALHLGVGAARSFLDGVQKSIK